jgi:hypothetical protein
MKFAIIFFALAVSYTLARAPIEEWRFLDNVMPQRSIEDATFRQGREYKFFYNGQLTTGIPGSSKQHSGNRIQALVTLAFTSSNNVLMRMEQVRMGKMNRQVPHPQKIMPFDSFEDVQMDARMKELLETPVKFTYTGGLVRDVYFDGKEQPWSANIKRGILNLIQVNLQQQKKLDTAEDQRLLNQVSTSEDNDDSTFYRVMEQTLEGECETLYTVTRQPHPKYTSGPVLNVTKSINFERCQKRPHIKYNFRFAHSCPTCESKYNDDEKFLKSSTVAKYNISGTKDSFLIESVRIESQHVFVPFNEESNVVVSYINQTLVLIKTGPHQGQIQEPRDQIESDSDMIYTLDWDVEREKMQMEGRTEGRFKKLPSSEINKVEMAHDQLQKVVRKIGESVQEGAPRAFSRLIAVMRMCNKQELERITEQFIRRDGQQQQWSNEESQKAKDILPQALAVCGTKDCVSQLLKHIRQNDIHHVKGALAIKSLINIRTPSKEIIQELIEFGQQSELMERSRVLKQSTWLTIGSLMNALCSPNEDVLAREYNENNEKFCPRSLKQSYVELLFRKGHESNRWDDNVLFMKTVSNAGLDLSVFELEKIISNRDKYYPSYLRQEAILALRQLRDIMPKKIQKILMPIVLNKRENPTVRIIATHMLLQSLPSRPILDQLAKLTHHDSSLQLISFLRSYMDSIANSTNPCEQRLATDMRLSLRHAKVVDTGLGHSKRVKLPFHSKKHSIGLDVNMFSIFSNTSYIPRRLAAQLNANFLGFWHKSLAQLTVAGEGLETLLEKLFTDDGYLYETESDSFLRRHSREQNEFRGELKNIFDTLKIKNRQQPEEYNKEPKAWISLKVKDQEIALLPFHKETIRSLLGESSENIREWESKLRQGIPLNLHGATVLHEMMYKIPTTLGMPLLVNVRIPAVVKLSGKIQATYDSLSKINIQANLKPSMVVTMVTEVECLTPTGDNGVKVIARAEVFTPIDARIETDFKNNDVEDIKITVRAPTTRRDLLVIETRPVTYTRQWPKTVNTWEEPEEKTIMGEELNRAITYQRCGGEKALGIEFCVRGHVHRTPAKSVVGTPFAPMSGPNKIVITCQPGQDAPEEITFKVNADMWQSMTESLKPSFRSSEFSRESHSNERRSVEDSNERSGESEYKNYIVKNGKRNTVKLTMEARNRRVTVELAHHYDPQEQYSKFNCKIVRSPLPGHPEQWTGCLKTEIMFPKKPYKLTEVDDKEIVGNAEFSWGRSCESENRITLKVKGEQSKEQIELYSRDPEYKMYENCEDRSLCSPVSQHEYLKEISQLLKYTVDVEYKNVPVAAKNITNKLFLILKNYYFWQTDIAQIMVRNPEEKIKAIIRIDPMSLQRINITVKTPTENTTFKDLPLPMKLSGFNVKNSWSWNNQFTDTCHVSSHKISTFDDVEYKVPMTTCYAVLAKDCSPEPSFAVLMKKLSENTEQKEVKIVTQEHRIILRSDSNDRVSVEVNGERVNPEESKEYSKHGHVVCRVEKEGPYVEIILPESGVKVYFDGYACNVKLSKMYQNQQCGLCGHYDEEYSDEFRTADFRRTDDVREFYKSYVMQDQQCSLPTDDKICNDEDCDYEPAWESNDNIESEDEMLSSEKPTYRTKIVELNDQLCFSSVPLPQCPPHSYAERYGNEKNVNYVCFDRDEHRAEQYERQVRSEGQVLELKSLTPTFNRIEKLVEKCSSY